MRGRSLPAGLSFEGSDHPAPRAEFLADLTWVDSAGSRLSSQQIFDAVFGMIRGARRVVLLDMFLYNDFQMGVSSPLRPLARQLTELLLRQKNAFPDIRIVVITDPFNTAYGSVSSWAFAKLEAADIEVVITDLACLRDSNPAYSVVWRSLVRPLGNSTRGRLPSPFDPRKKMTLRSYLAMPNFKANHRKVVITDEGDGLVGMVTSANPHDASSAHTNVACLFSGAAVHDLLSTENAVLALSGRNPVSVAARVSRASGEVSVKVVTERAIKAVALELIDGMRQGERLDLACFYISDRDIIRALKRAHRRGVCLRVLLDPNKDAFGYKKFGIPNRPVAAELAHAGVDVRWSHTHGEQCHDKMLLGVDIDGDARLLLGSANMTRRNLEDFNLETNVLVRGDLAAAVLGDAAAHFEILWQNRPNQVFSVPYAHYRDESVTKRFLYRFMEATGFCTF